MTVRTPRFAALWASLLAFSALQGACRGSDDDSGGGTPDAGGGAVDSGGPAEDTTVFKVQGDLAEDVVVSLRGVVLVAIDNYGGRKGNIWIAEPEGGPRSGVMVYGVPPASLANLKVGDLVDIEGVVRDEFAYQSRPGDTSFGDPITELKPAEGGVITITKQGDGVVPAPALVDAVAIGRLATAAERHAAWEEWEGVLVRLENVDGLAAARFIDEDEDETWKELRVRGPALLESAQVAFPDPAGADTCWTSVVGIVDYFYNFKIVPRSAADITTTAGTCDVAEEAAVDTCGDTIDNDGDGLADCMDRSCQGAVPACSSDTTVTAVQNGTAVGAVRLSRVVVTAIDSKRQNLWVQDVGPAAARNGLYIFRGFSMTPAVPDTIQVGSLVNLSGNVVEFRTTGSEDLLTQVRVAVADGVVAIAPAETATTSVLTGVTVEQLIGASSEDYEGVVVELSDVPVLTRTGDRGTVGTLAQTLNVGSDIVPFTATMGQCLTTLRGVVHYNTFPNEGYIKLLPRSAADIVVGTCD